MNCSPWQDNFSQNSPIDWWKISENSIPGHKQTRGIFVHQHSQSEANEINFLLRDVQRCGKLPHLPQNRVFLDGTFCHNFGLAWPGLSTLCESVCEAVFVKCCLLSRNIPVNLRRCDRGAMARKCIIFTRKSHSIGLRLFAKWNESLSVRIE